MKGILPILKKELRRFLTDKRFVAGLILPGVLLFVMYSVMGGVMNSLFSVDDDFEYTVYIENEPTEFDGFLNNEILTIHKEVVDSNTDIDLVKQGITDGDIHLLIIYPEDFQSSVGQGLEPEIHVYYNLDNTESYYLYNFYVGCLNEFESQLTNLFDVNLEGDFNLSTKKEPTNPMMLMLPMLLLTLLVSAVVGSATESIAGEKERGTIATLLITPVSRYKIAISKVIAVCVPSMISAISSFIGIALSIPKLFPEDSGMDTFDMPGFAELSGLLVVILVTVLLFTVLVSLISTFAKSIKEATQLAMPIMLISSMCGLMVMFLSSPATGCFFIPVLNSTLMIASVFDATFSVTNLLITVFTNIAVIALGIFVIGKMFNSEKVMFNKS